LSADMIREACRALSGAKRGVALCGAGLSAESGIQTFRDEGGIWGQIDVSEMGTVNGLLRTLERDAGKLLPFFQNLLEAFINADANPGHRALAALEENGFIESVITQNGDNMHREAGSRKIIELHGNFFRMKCLSCGVAVSMDRKPFLRDIRDRLNSLRDYSLAGLVSLAPRCAKCGGLMRPDVVMFGEPVQGLFEAIQAAKDCDVMLVLGTSGMVYPASSIPYRARKDGAFIVEINPREHAFEGITDLYIPMPAGEALPEILKGVGCRAVSGCKEAR